MNYTVHILLLLAFFTPSVYSASLVQTCLQKASSFFHRTPIEKIDHKEIATLSLKSISIENYNGPITIKTGWKKDHLCLKTIRRAKKQTDLDAIKIIADSTQSHHLAIQTKYLQKNIKGSVEYELIVPTSLGLSLSTQNGNICINDINGKIHATTNNGTITITNTTNTLYAHNKQQGSIFIEKAYGPIEASSEHGSITIANAHNNVIAHSTTGKIMVTHQHVPHSSRIQLTTTSGNLTLALPTTINATIQGSTIYGSLFSDHYITINPYTTQLNHYAWNKFKKEVNGTIGSGDAHVSLCSTYGTIKILQNQQIVS